jgi:hypothetical protein
MYWQNISFSFLFTWQFITTENLVIIWPNWLTLYCDFVKWLSQCGKKNMKENSSSRNPKKTLPILYILSRHMCTILKQKLFKLSKKLRNCINVRYWEAIVLSECQSLKLKWSSSNLKCIFTRVSAQEKFCGFPVLVKNLLCMYNFSCQNTTLLSYEVLNSISRSISVSIHQMFSSLDGLF